MLSDYLDKKPTIGENNYIDPQARIIGAVKTGKDCSFWPMSVVRGDVNFIDIGDRCNVQDGSILHVTHRSERFNNKGSPLIIGNEVTIGHGAKLHACNIGSRVLIGIGSIILDRAKIHNDVMLGAGALVTSDSVLESGWLYLGSPAKAARRLKVEEIEFLQYSALHYVKVMSNYSL